MNLQTFKYPAPSMTLNTDKELLIEAKDRGFYNGRTEWNDLFSQLFFYGGTIPLKTDLDSEFRDSCLPYLKSFMGSFEPKHEEKNAIAALLLSELCTPASENTGDS